MELIAIALITTVAMSWYSFFYVLRKELMDEGYTDGPMIQQPLVASMVFICIAFIISPLLLLCVIVPEVKESFYNGFKKAMIESNT